MSKASSGPSCPDLAGLKAAGAEVVSITEALQKPPRWLKDALGKINPQDRDPVVALNLALMSGGVGLRLAKGVSLDKPVHLIHSMAAASLPA